jgi:hypothetical protein
MKTDESNPKDWFWLAKERLESADALVDSRGVRLSAIELLQESVERYLKGYLISKGWKLERIHDLNRLLDLSIEHCLDFSAFIPLALVSRRSSDFRFQLFSFPAFQFSSPFLTPWTAKHNPLGSAFQYCDFCALLRQLRSKLPQEVAEDTKRNRKSDV